MIYSVQDRFPELSFESFVAPSADIIGSVRLARFASVWFQVVLRGDNDWIEIGEGSNIQDGTVIHTDTGLPTRIGSGVTVGHKAFLHGCIVGDNSMIANGALVLDHAQIGQNCIIAAGALVAPNKIIPDGSVVMGSPGKIIRQVTASDLALIARAAVSYHAHLAIYRTQLKEIKL